MARSKASKSKPRSGSSTAESAAPQEAGIRRAPFALSPPAKKPALLAVSIVLFGLWFVYLLVIALGG